MAKIKTTKSGTTIATEAVTNSTPDTTTSTVTPPKRVKLPAKKKKTPSLKNRSFRAGIIFPVGRTQRLLKTKSALNKARVGPGPAIFLASVLEYLTAEVLELSGDQAHALGAKRINERSIKLAVEADAELDQLFKSGHVSILGGGATPTFGIVKSTPASKIKRGKATNAIKKDKEEKKADEEPKRKKKRTDKSEEGEGEPVEKKQKKKKTTKSSKKKKVQKDTPMEETA